MVLGHLLPGALDGGPGRDDAGDGLAGDGAGQRPARAMTFGSFLCAMAGRLAALTKTRHQRTGPHIANLSECGFQFVALETKGMEIRGRGHVLT